MNRSMAKAQKKRQKPVEKPVETHQPKDFLDLIAPAAVKFNTDSYVLGGLYRCVLALRGYPPSPRSWPCSPTSATGPASPSTSTPAK